MCRSTRAAGDHCMRLAQRQGRHGMSLGTLLGSYAEHHMSIRGSWDEATYGGRAMCAEAHEQQGTMG